MLAVELFRSIPTSVLVFLATLIFAFLCILLLLVALVPNAAERVIQVIDAVKNFLYSRGKSRSKRRSSRSGSGKMGGKKK
jgi:predicted PurR-regulated permease PerM